MKKLVILIVGAIMMTSCGTTGTGALTGAMFGGMIGSAIGGIGGGPRGSDIGTLIGMSAGAMAGAAVGSAAEQQTTQSYYAQHHDGTYTRSSSENNYGQRGGAYQQGTERSDQPLYDDVITMETPTDTMPAVTAPLYTTDIVISNVRFINDANTQHISAGELVRISFEIRNVTQETKYNIVPVVKETTGNKRLLVSPSTLIESLPARKALRYTAFVSAQENLKSGTAHFVISVDANKNVASNIVEFDVPLE